MPVTDPKARIVFGVVILLVAAMASCAVSLERIRYWMLGIAVFGLAMMRSGVLHRRHDARVRRELDRAEGEWTELMRDAVAARHQGEGVARLLQRRGYHEFFIRRWIADRLAQELSHGGVRVPPS